MPFGAIPAGGAEIPTFLAFGLERKLDRRRKDPQFGKGAIRGLAAPESAANATAGSAMGSLLALGLPTSATAAIMLAAFQQYGMQPGPLLFTRNSRPGLGAAGQPVHRDDRAADHQPAVRARSGRSCC